MKERDKEMKREVIFLFLILFLIVLKPVKAEKVEPIVEKTLESEEEVGVIVLLNDEKVTSIEKIRDEKSINQENDKELKKIMIERQQNKVLQHLKVGREVAGVRLGLKSRNVDFELKHKYTTVNAFSGEVTKEGLETLKQDPNVKKIYLDKVMNINLDDSIPQINADDVWNLTLNNTNITGKGETICITDSGIDTDHNAFTGRIIQQYCYCALGGGCCPDDTSEDISAEDDNGHGTHVTGIAAGNFSQYIGVAPKSNIIAIKVCNASGACATSDVIKGIDWCTNNASKYNISVISMSLGGGGPYNSYCNDDSLAPSINSAAGQNILVAVSAGNTDWTNGISSPACVQNATPVGGVDKSDNIDYNRGSILRLLAPGVSITSPYIGGSTTPLSGTSMAAPHVAGAAALIFQFKKLENGTTLTPEQVEDILNDTGTQIDDSGGSGLIFSRIDVLAAVQSLDTKKPTWLNNQTNNTAPKFNQTVQFNITFNDSIGLSNYIFSWNDTGNWINKTNGTLTKNLETISLNETITATRGKEVYWKFYFNDTNSNWNETDQFKFTVQNTAPTVTLLSPTDGQIFSYRNPTINYSCYDSDNDVCTYYTYINDRLNTTSTANITNLFFDNDNYSLVVMVSDSYINSTNSTSISFFVNRSITSNFASNCTNATKTGKDAYWSIVLNETGVGKYWLMYSQDIASGNWTNTTQKQYNNLENITTNITITSARSKDVNATFFYNDSLGELGQTGYIGCTVNNTMPYSNFSVSINSPVSDNDDLNGTITKYSDADGDTWTSNGTKWYINNNLNSSYDNLTNISKDNTGVGDQWIFSARVFDGYDWSEWINSSAVTINDTQIPAIVKNYTSAGSVNINNELTIYLNLTDASSIDNTTVKAEVEFNNLKTNHTMTKHSGNSSANKVTGWIKTYSPSTEGTYYVKYYFCDSNNNCGNSSDRALSFTATVQTVQTTSTGGSGGGGGGGGGGSVSSTKTESHFYSTLYKGDTTTMDINKEEISVNKIIFTGNKQLDRVTIKVERIDNFSDKLNNVYQYLSLETENLKNTDFDTAFIEFEANKSWADRFDKIFLNRYFNDKWDKLKTDEIGEVNESVVYRAVTPGFSVFAITGEREAIKEQEQKNITKEVNETAPESVEEVKEELMPAPERKIKLESLVVPIIISILFMILLILIFKKKNQS